MNELIAKVRLAMLSMQRRPWEQGVAAQALLEIGDIETAILLAQDAAYLQISDGRLAMPDVQRAVTDPAVNGAAVLAAARHLGDASLLAAAQRQADYLLYKAPRTADGILHHNNDAPQLWIDSMYMAPPFLAEMGYFDAAVHQIKGFRKYLWSPEKRLFSHIWDEGTHSFVREAHWGVGNGWAAAGYARVIDALPPSRADQRERLIEEVRSLLDGCLACQREDGLFHDVIDDSSAFVETNLAQMLAYTIYRGVHAGWLKSDDIVHADRMRTAVHHKVDGHGWVHGVCGAPNFDRPGVATEGQAFFLLMEAAYRKLTA